MATQITKQTTNYTISTSTKEEIKLEGTFSANIENKIENYNATFFNADGNLIGSASYGEYDTNVNYNYNVQPDYRLVIITLMDESITDIKTEISK